MDPNHSRAKLGITEDLMNNVNNETQPADFWQFECPPTINGRGGIPQPNLIRILGMRVSVGKASARCGSWCGAPLVKGSIGLHG